MRIPSTLLPGTRSFPFVVQKALVTGWPVDLSSLFAREYGISEISTLQENGIYGRYVVTVRGWIHLIFFKKN